MRISAALLVTFLALAACPAHAPQALFTPGAEIEVEDSKRALLQRIEVEIRPETLTPGAKATIVFPLPQRDVKVVLEPVETKELALPPESAAWTGTADGDGEVFVMRIGNSIEASLQMGNRSYRLRTLEGRRGVLEVFDTNRLQEPPNDGLIDPNPRPGPKEDRPDSTCQDPASRVDVMVLYTPAARDASGGVLAIENEIAFAVGRTNLAYANSNNAHRLNLVHVGLAAYTEPSAGVNSAVLLGALANTNDGVLDSVHGLRDGRRADLVSLVYEVDDGITCGRGHLQESANADTTDHWAFSVVQRSCAGGNLTLAHETGHNLGAKHDRANADGALNFNYGHIQPTPTTSGVTPWRTVMSYPNPCGSDSATGSCARVPWFSNPEISRSGDATGAPLTSPEPEHNVHAFAQNAGEVSRYRCLRDSSGPNVWMKDRWEDQGREPDPNTAGKAMWESPYIWVRHEEDLNHEHEHEHENPRLGETNYVYVKLHNTGSAPETGTLELYAAYAGTNLNNPANWTQIGSDSHTAVDGVEVMSFVWDDLPGAGHYCLMARWNTDGSSLAFTNFGAAVRASNDLIWRNVNIVELSGPDLGSEFEMVGAREERETFLFIQMTPRSPVQLPWSKLARVRFDVDHTKLDEDHLHVDGMERVDKGTFEVALDGGLKLLGPFTLDPGEKTRVQLHVDVDLAQVKHASAQLANPAVYELRVSQIEAGGASLALQDPATLFTKSGLVLGGVTYQLRVPAAK